MDRLVGRQRLSFLRLDWLDQRAMENGCTVDQLDGLRM